MLLVYVHTHANLKWYVRVIVEVWYFVTPGGPLLGLGVKEIIKYGPLTGELDVLEFTDPPLGELNPVIYQLYKYKQQ